jgi:hypothetical protein
MLVVIFRNFLNHVFYSNKIRPEMRTTTYHRISSWIPLLQLFLEGNFQKLEHSSVVPKADSTNLLLISRLQQTHTKNIHESSVITNLNWAEMTKDKTRKPKLFL